MKDNRLLWKLLLLLEKHLIVFSDKGRILMRQKYSGNLLFTAMAIVYLMSFLALQLLEERQLTQNLRKLPRNTMQGKVSFIYFLQMLNKIDES